MSTTDEVPNTPTRLVLTPSRMQVTAELARLDTNAERGAGRGTPSRKLRFKAIDDDEGWETEDDENNDNEASTSAVRQYKPHKPKYARFESPHEYFNRMRARLLQNLSRTDVFRDFIEDESRGTLKSSTPGDDTQTPITLYHRSGRIYPPPGTKAFRRKHAKKQTDDPLHILGRNTLVNMWTQRLETEDQIKHWYGSKRQMQQREAKYNVTLEEDPDKEKRRQPWQEAFNWKDKKVKLTKAARESGRILRDPKLPPDGKPQRPREKYTLHKRKSWMDMMLSQQDPEEVAKGEEIERKWNENVQRRKAQLDSRAETSASSAKAPESKSNSSSAPRQRPSSDGVRDAGGNRTENQAFDRRSVLKLVAGRYRRMPKRPTPGQGLPGFEVDEEGYAVGSEHWVMRKKDAEAVRAAEAELFWSMKP